MYIVRNSNKEIVLISTKRADAEAVATGAGLDKTTYTIEEQTND